MTAHRLNWLFVGVLVLLSGCSEKKSTPPPIVLPDKSVVDCKRFEPTQAEQERIDALIDRLTDVDRPGDSFSNQTVGYPFAPIKESTELGLGFLARHDRLRTSKALEQLVALGPKALPQLLQRLTDKTRTQVVMEHYAMFGLQSYGREVPYNADNAAELEIHRQLGYVTDDET